MLHVWMFCAAPWLPLLLIVCGVLLRSLVPAASYSALFWLRNWAWTCA